MISFVLLRRGHSCRKTPQGEAQADERPSLRDMMLEAVASLDGGLETILIASAATKENRFATLPRELVFGRPAQAALGIEHYMCVAPEIVPQGLLSGP